MSRPDSNNTSRGGQLPVDRDYDWSEYTLNPSRVPKYVSSNGEYETVLREIESREETGKLPHFRLCGPTGCGKTALAESVAVELQEQLGQPVPVFEVNCHDGLRPSNIVGQPTYVGEQTWWQDGPGTKALQASQEGPTVVILDEFNRAPARAQGVFFSMLDHQCSLTLDARGGERIEGDPMNLIVFSTMNQGEGYIVNRVDRAQIRRLGNTFYTDFLGMDNVGLEADLLTERTPLGEEVATALVRCANDIRQKARDDSAVSMGVPTAAMLDWARTTWAHRDSDIDGGPVLRAAEIAVLNPYYKGDKQEEEIVRATIESHVKEMPAVLNT